MKKFHRRKVAVTEADYKSMKYLIDLHSMTNKAIAEALGWSEATVMTVKTMPTWEAYRKQKEEFRQWQLNHPRNPSSANQKTNDKIIPQQSTFADPNHPWKPIYTAEIENLTKEINNLVKAVYVLNRTLLNHFDNHPKDITTPPYNPDVTWTGVAPTVSTTTI